MEQREKFRSYSVLANLMHVDLDAARAYAQAVDAIGASAIRRRLEAFRHDHERHIEAIAEEIRALGMQPPGRLGRRGFLLTGYTAIFAAMGPESALRALRANETLTNHRYDQALTAADLPDSLRQLIERHRQDERRHIRFLEDAIEKRSWESAGADAAAEGR
jgi:hypothetical protein